MKRKTIHSGFAAVTVCLTAFAGLQWLDLSESKAIALAIAQIPASLAPEHDTFQPIHYPEAQLARANALSKGGSFDEAESAFNQLIHQNELNPTGQAALFNLANAYLRQGMRRDLSKSRTGPMLELAKRRYRDLLRAIPNDWDARYNLELALRLAPEGAETSAQNEIDPVKSVRVIVPDFKAKDLP